jgi:hypothetical protein
MKPRLMGTSRIIEAKNSPSFEPLLMLERTRLAASPFATDGGLTMRWLRLVKSTNDQSCAPAG